MTAHLPLSALRAFEAAASLGSFKAAAARLNVTPGAVSQQIRLLEGFLGLTLFERANRQVKLTDAGRELAVATHDAFGGIERTLRRLSAKGLAAGPATLCITVAPSFGTKWLAPRLHRFQAANPELELRVSASDAVVDLHRAPEFDVALRYGPGPYPEFFAERLFAGQALYPVGRPELGSMLQAGASPAALLDHTLIRMRPDPTARLRTEDWIADWRRWLLAAGLDADSLPAQVDRGPLFSNAHLALEAAASGVGIALAPSVLAAHDIDRGRLVRLFEIGLPDPCGYWFLTTPDRMAERRVRAFHAWLRRECAADAAA